MYSITLDSDDKHGNLLSLMHLSASDNMIHHLDQKILNTSPHLGNIFLSNNKLTSMLNLSVISNTVMMVCTCNLVKIRLALATRTTFIYVDISSCVITSVEDICNYACKIWSTSLFGIYRFMVFFKIVRYLFQVSLDRNKIGEVPAGCLQNLTHLVQLGLSGNKIKHFPGR